MATVNWDYFYPEVFVTVGGAEVELIHHYIREAAIAFCELSEAWKLDILPIDVETGKKRYQLVAPLSDTEIVRVLHTKYNGNFINVMTYAEIAANNLDDTASGNPCGYYQDLPDNLDLYPVPQSDIAMALECKVAIRPSRTANGIEAEIGKRYFNAIANGAKAMLFALPSKPWTDGAAFAFYNKLMIDAAAKAKNESSRGLGRGTLRTKLHLVNGH